MKGLIALLLSLFLVLAFTSCDGDSAKKITADVLSQGLSSGIIVSLDCKNATAVKADVKTQMYRWFSIEAKEKSIAASLCKAAIKGVVPSLIGAAAPATWECKVTTVTNLAAVLAEEVYKKLED